MLERLLSPGSSTPPGRVGSRGAVADATTLRFGRAPCRTKSALRPRVATASPFHRGWPVNGRRAWEDGGNGPTAAQVDADLAPSAGCTNDQGSGRGCPSRIFILQGRPPGGPGRCRTKPSEETRSASADGGTVRPTA